MTKPLFAPKWFKDVPAAELRQEIQNLYRLVAKAGTGEKPEPVDLGPIEDSIADLEAALAGYLPLEGGTLTGPLNIENADTMNWTNNGGNVILNVGGGGAGYIRNGGSGSSLNIGGGTSSSDGPNIQLNQGSSGVLRHNTTNRLLWDADGVYLAVNGTTTTSAVRADRTISAGNGLTGGGNLTANRSLALGTPGSISPTTTNTVSSTSHTHALSWPDTLGAVGSWAFMVTQDGSSVSPGGTVAGSGLRYAAANGQVAGSPTPSGTWRAMGYKYTGNVGATVFVRIS